jgi:hypothetical protein
MVYRNWLIKIFLSLSIEYIGDQDPLVQLKWARLTEQGIKAMGFKQYAFREYNNMGHSSCDRVIIRFWLLSINLNWLFISGNERC